MINFKDRIPAVGKANRKLITPEGGGSPYYAVITTADDGEAGTPLNRLNLMAMQGFGDTITTFNANGTITETFSDSSQKVTEFTAGGVVETYTAGAQVLVKTTTFNADGSISEVIS